MAARRGDVAGLDDIETDVHDVRGDGVAVESDEWEALEVGHGIECVPDPRLANTGVRGIGGGSCNSELDVEGLGHRGECGCCDRAEGNDGC